MKESPFDRARVDDALEVLKAHANWVGDLGHIGECATLAEAERVLLALRNVRQDQKPQG